MAGLVTATLLASSYDTVDRTTYSTASISPAANKPVMLFVAARVASAVPPTSVSGNGITYTQYDSVGGSNHNVSVWTGSSTSPTSGVVTFDFNSVTQAGCAWAIVQFTNSDPGSNGASCIVQSQKSFGSSLSSISLSLSAFSSTANSTIGFTSVQLNEAIGKDSAFTQLSNDAGTPPLLGNLCQFFQDQDTSVTSSWSVADTYRAFAAEIKYLQSRHTLLTLGAG